MGMGVSVLVVVGVVVIVVVVMAVVMPMVVAVVVVLAHDLGAPGVGICGDLLQQRIEIGLPLIECTRGFGHIQHGLRVSARCCSILRHALVPRLFGVGQSLVYKPVVILRVKRLADNTACGHDREAGNFVLKFFLGALGVGLYLRMCISE